MAIVKVSLTWPSKAIPGVAGGQQQNLGGPGGFFSFPVVNPAVVRNINVPLLGAPPGGYIAVGFPAAFINAAPALHWGPLSLQLPGSLLLGRSLTPITLDAMHNWRQVPESDRQYVPEPGLLKVGWLKRRPEQAIRSVNNRLAGAGAKRALRDRPVVPVGEDVLLGDSSLGPAAMGDGWDGCPWLNPATGILVGMDLGWINTARPTTHYAASLGGSRISTMGNRLGVISRINLGPLQPL
jgi:hypothetical protein